MSTFEDMNMEICLEEKHFEDGGILPDSSGKHDGKFPDGFTNGDDALLENPFTSDAEPAAEFLSVQEKTAADGVLNDTEEDDCLETDGAEDSDMEKESEDKRRLEHEAAEARRKKEWEDRQQAKKEAEQAQLAQISALSDEEVTAEAMKRVGADTERLTRRNMKECVSEYIQTMCLEDPAFARLTMHPRKTMVHCFYYINRKAREFVEQEMKDNDAKPENGIYGSDVPDDLCYQWAEEYFRDPDAKEDQEKEEKFIPKAYTGKSGTSSQNTKSAAKKANGKEKNRKKAEKKVPEKAADNGQFQQMTLAGLAG